MPCLKCGHKFKTVPEKRLCRDCTKINTEMQNSSMTDHDRCYREKLYGDLGVFERRSNGCAEVKASALPSTERAAGEPQHGRAEPTGPQAG